MNCVFMCVYARLCVFVCVSVGGGGGWTPTPQGFVNGGERVGCHPSQVLQILERMLFYAMLYFVLCYAIFYAVDSLLAEILRRQLLPKFDILNIIALVSNTKLQNQSFFTRTLLHSSFLA